LKGVKNIAGGVFITDIGRRKKCGLFPLIYFLISKVNARSVAKTQTRTKEE
jgi:hypothetical protein